ncbi:hypothetical protein H105_04251 [Trichophyton soudanense CBS 452.61]|uniref:SAP domain-containing protein n=1 Tax=Trichophyton soudanense CBS 452.61 TaxID=1215331 RepID=A0A022XTA9_TRISD|nr:hypothetical protein H105_04251 [Trichophyton soudanense CBS 452.61]EZG06266.1 hypothetical protein H106_04051 [Trichophyton rubrum CBS 735.88]
MDYGSLKVTDLKAELKKRGIPQTGLRVKQNFIDRLIQDDNERAGTSSETPAEPVEPAPAPAQQPTNAAYQEPPPEPPQAPVPQAAQLPSKPVEEPPAQQILTTEVQQTVVPESAPAPVPTQKVTSISQLIEPVSAPPVAQAPVPTPKPAVAETVPAPVTELAVEDVTPALAAPAPEPEPVKEPVQEPVKDESVNKSPSADIEAIREDTDESRKRKRRSQTPPPSPRSIALKKARLEEEQQQSRSTQEEIKGEERKEEQEALAAAPVIAEPPARDTDVEMKEGTPPAPEPKQEAEEDESKDRVETQAPGHEEPSDRNEKPHAQRKPVGDARFKDLFPATNGAPLRPESPPPAEGDDRMVSPALHPATTALYIRDFMRPLQPAALKRHLCSLAVPPNSSPDPDVIVDFFLDSIKTHCFASFTSIAAASRVRAALHDAIWPEERTRKPLWADFIPEEKVKEWIEIEVAPGNSGRGGPRWEVTYDETEDGIKARLQEASSITSGPPRPYDSSQGREPPTGPRADRMGPGGRQGSQQIGPSGSKMPEHGFKALDDRFLSTVAKPKLYYLPVAREVSDRRLDQFDDLARAGPVSKRGGDEMFRYTFEDTDQFVVQGPEYGSRRGGRGRGGGRGGRGDWGSSWRDGPWRGRR